MVKTEVDGLLNEGLLRIFIVSRNFMRIPVTISIFLLTTSSFAQRDGNYSTFSSAFQNIDSAKSIYINCMHNNEFGTDGCDSLPSDIDKFYNLTSLYISESRIKTLPTSINQLKKLKELHLKYLFFFNYEKELCKLRGLDSLEYLGLWMAGIKTLPDCIGQMKSLKNIDLSQNENVNIEKAFQTFKQLPNLEILNLSGIGNLSVIPKDISEITNLKSLQLDYLTDKFDYKTSFERIALLKIKSLSLTHNWLSALPSTISELKDLEYINLSDNNFESFPIELFALTNLKEIKIQHNNHTFINVGNEITKLENLEKINFGNNWRLNGKHAIITLSKLPKLKDLDFFSCRLDSIPTEIGNFRALEKLNLTRNPQIAFAELFRKLSPVKTLKYLDISDNKIASLPKEIGLLSSLEYLVIGQNFISNLPEEFFSLTNLKTLNVYGNYDRRIPNAELEKVRQRLPNCKIINEWVFRD